MPRLHHPPMFQDCWFDSDSPRIAQFRQVVRSARIGAIEADSVSRWAATLLKERYGDQAYDYWFQKVDDALASKDTFAVLAWAKVPDYL